MEQHATSITALAEGAESPDFAAMCDAFPLAVLVLRGDVFTLAYANAAAERLLNTSAKVMVGKALAELVQLDAGWQELLAEAPGFRHGVKGYELPLHSVKPDSFREKVNAYIQPLANEGELLLAMEPGQMGEKLGLAASRRDSMRSAAVMADILAHEVRNPLSGIKGAAQLLQQDAKEDDRELLELICSEVERIGGLLNQVEYFSTDQAIACEPVNIHEVLRYVRDVASRGVAAHVQFEEEYDPSLPEVQGNRELLVQALLNLVKNAAEAVAGQEEAVITLKTAYRSGYRVLEADGKTRTLPIAVEVRDTGPGVPEDMRAHIFNPFVTNKMSGKGLGLPVVAKIVEDHGGVLALEGSEAGKTVFAMQLPAWKA